MIPTILLTGFGPFGDNSSNPSQVVCQRAVEIVPEAEYHLHTLVLPVSFRRCPEMLLDALECLRPHAVLSLGLAARARRIAIELFAVNMDDASLPDVDGICRQGQPIRPGGPAAYRSTLPNEEMLHAMRRWDVPARLSNHAGTYLCNHCLYVACDWAAGRCGTSTVGFAHLLPTSGASDGSPGMPIERSVQAVGWLLDTIASHCSTLSAHSQTKETKEQA